MIIGAALTIHIIIALAVSVHILLTKREARAAFGWLGVAWLSPFIGSFCYAIFGINRIARRALKLRQTNSLQAGIATRVEHKNGRPQKIPHVESVGNALSRHRVVGGNHLEIFQNGDEAYPEMISAINGAKKTIALSSYIFRMDENGVTFVNALRAAKERGVEIKVLIDGVGGGFFFCPATSRLRSLGIDAHRFLQSLLPWDMPYLNLRNHKKLLIIDGKRGFVGGMNIGSENLLRKKSKLPVRDTHFCFSGPVIVQLLESFVEDWSFTTDEVLDGSGWWPKLKSQGNVKARVIDSGPDHDLGNVEKLLAAAIGSAKHYIRIVTPYFLPDERIGFLLDMAVLRGVTVELVIPQHTDFSLFDWAMDGQLSFMDLNVIKCFRTPEPFDHSKLVTVDGEWCAIGSPNWDVRSMLLNFEILVECHDKDTVSRIDSLIDEKIASAVLQRNGNQNRQNYPSRLRNAVARLLMPYL